MRRFLAAILMMILVVVPTVAVSAQSDDGVMTVASEYKPRLTAPSYSNNYYYSNLNIFYSIGYGMPNCTAYAWGRAYELLGTRPKLSVDSAHYWYDYNKDHNYYPYGSTPKLGAIACWDNPYGGHVAVVEKITSTTVTMSHSAYGGTRFYTTEYALGAPNGGATGYGWKFEGYIYILDGEILPEGDVYRVDSDNGINLRKGPGTSYQTLTAIPNDTEIVVTDTKKADGYLWGKTDFDGFKGWCVLDFCELIYEKPDETVPETTPPTEPETTVPPTEATADEPDVNAPADTTEPSAPGGSSGADKPVFGTGPGNIATAPAKPSEDLGDVNGDGKVNIGDATVLQKHLAGMNVTVSSEKTDVNGDGKVTVGDATYIQKLIASLV